MDNDQFLTVVSEDSGFHISVSGPPTGARLRSLLETIVAESKSRGLARVLLDARGVPPPVLTTDKYDIGVAAGQALGRRIKLAVVGSPAAARENQPFVSWAAGEYGDPRLLPNGIPALHLRRTRGGQRRVRSATSRMVMRAQSWRGL
jgi:hypothetical protein